MLKKAKVSQEGAQTQATKKVANGDFSVYVPTLLPVGIVVLPLV